MRSTQAAREMMASSGLTHRQAAHRLDRSDSYISQVIGQKSIGCDVMADIARACGYTLQLVPLDGGAAITIGDDDAPDRDDTPSLDEARALLARAAAILDRMDE